ncbi:endo-1,4-beta-xylanase [Protaetiibacter intestinalis]|uniref:Beta-xylanase n=1 Tax=Protaetiibacter intestinalis TaxID=2419774 RepID=A0A387B3P2_9MICO|nr:endo-1,4-beta-xylanase [Protaetiibacter intestinalis]AYF98192.1 hypothetical protein D7I47_07955 [Protaetiibacter intestinalis]
MSTRRRLETFAAATAALTLAAGSLLAISWTAAAATAPVPAGQQLVSWSDFEGASVDPWVPRGPVALAIDADAHQGSGALKVTGRTEGWNGPSLPGSLLTSGTYHISGWVKLVSGQSATKLNFGVNQPGASNEYPWVGDRLDVTDSAWVQIGGDFTVDAAHLPSSIYIEAVDGTVEFLVDDVLITQDTVVTTIQSSDFEGASVDPWVPRGPVALAIDADAHQGSGALKVTGRTEGWNGPSLPGSLLTSGTYHISGWVKLVSGQSATKLNFGVNQPGASNEYPWVGDRLDVTDSAWVQIGGDFTVDAAHLPSSIYIEAVDGTVEFLVDDVLITQEGTSTPPVDAGDPGALSTDFEDGLDGWGPRDNGAGAPTVAITTDDTYVHGGEQAAALTGRLSQGSGIGHDATGLLLPGPTYTLSAWVRFAAGEPVDAVWLSLQTTTGSTDDFKTLVQFDNVTNTGWTHVSGDFTVPAGDSSFIYFETNYNGDNTSALYVDDIEVSARTIVIEDLTPIKDTVDFPVGVAIDTRETVGAAEELTLKHFDQITAENAMKPEGWYDAEKQFSPSGDIDALMDFAQENDLKVYGHVLAWHSQTPAWFFEDAEGAPLTTSDADKAILRQRLHDHIFAVAQYLADGWGDFGSDTNPLYAFDVVNEVVSDSGEYADGLRRSEWYRILGEEFIDDAFEYANEAFNDTYAADGADHPVTLFINDYNTEQSGKQVRYHALVERLLARGVPVDGVGHQFHVSLSMPVSALEAAIEAFEDLPVRQAVTEFDVTTGTPVTDAKLVDQGYYFRDAFRVFRAHAEDLFSVTVWGLNDGRSWRSSSGAPLVFNDGLQAKPAYYGIVDTDLPARLRTADVFQADVPAVDGATDDPEWSRLPLHALSSTAGFQLRWESDHLTAYVDVADTTSGNDQVSFQLGDDTVTLGRDGSGDADGVVAETATGYRMVVELPLEAAEQGDELAFDVRVRDGATTTGWNAEGVTGTLTLREPVSFTQVVQASVAPTIDGTIDGLWDDANVVTTAKHVQGTGAEATVRTLWYGDKLYVLAVVADPIVDVSGSDPWVQDSVEIFVDPGNAKNGSYRYDDSQIRISATNTQSFGTGDEAFQAGRVQSATSAIDGGYVVEAAIDLDDYVALGALQGLDFQVNDASGGSRTGIANWADPTGAGYQSTARWGVGELVGPAEGGEEPDDATVTLGASSVRAGGTLDVSLSGFEPGTVVDLVLDRPASAAGGGGGVGIAAVARSASAAALPATLGSLTVGQSGTAAGSVTVPADTTPGSYRLAATVDGDVLASGQLTVLAALAATGSDPGAGIGAALLLLLAGVVLMARHRRRRETLRL